MEHAIEQLDEEQAQIIEYFVTNRDKLTFEQYNDILELLNKTLKQLTVLRRMHRATKRS